MTTDAYGIRPTNESDIPGIIDLSRLVYPADLYRSDELRHQLAHFPAGQFVALSNNLRLIGMSSCLRLQNDQFAVGDDWITVTGNGTLSTHDPQGDVLYGVETMVHPEWRHNGVGTDLVVKRFQLARSLGVSAIRTGIRLAAYGAVASVLTPIQYVSLVVARRMSDPALSFMLKFGFKVVAVSEHYLHRDPESAGAAAILEYIP